MIPAGQHGRACRRAERRGVETGVLQPLSGESFSSRGLTWPAKRTGGSEAYIVQQDNEDIRRSDRRTQRPNRRKFRVGVFGVIRRKTDWLTVRNRQHLAAHGGRLGTGRVERRSCGGRRPCEENAAAAEGAIRSARTIGIAFIVHDLLPCVWMPDGPSFVRIWVRDHHHRRMWIAIVVVVLGYVTYYRSSRNRRPKTVFDNDTADRTGAANPTTYAKP
jgi:hypothetical protein